MENDTGGEGIVTEDEKSKTKLVNDVTKRSTELREVTEIETKTTTRTETFGIRIAGARLLSESGKVESVARGIPPKETLLSNSPSPFYTSTQSMRHTSPLSESASQTVVVQSESSQVSSSTLSTEPVLLKEESPPVADGSSDKPPVNEKTPHPAAEEVKLQSQATESSANPETSKESVTDPVHISAEKKSASEKTPERAPEKTETAAEEKSAERESRKLEEPRVEEPVVDVEELRVSKEERKAEETEIAKSEEPKAEKVEELKSEKIKHLKVEKVEEPKVEKVKEPKVEKVEEPKVEKVEEPKVEIKKPKVEKAEEPKVEEIEKPKVEKVEEPEVKNVKESKIENVKEPNVEKVEEPKVEKVEKPKVKSPEKANVEEPAKIEQPSPQFAQDEPGLAPVSDVVTAEAETSSSPSKEPDENTGEEEAVTSALQETTPNSQITTEEMASAEIQEENIKNQLHQIIKEIDYEVSKEEDGASLHTWKPKGRYEVKRTPIKYEEVVPITLPDVKLQEREKVSPEKIEEEPPKEEISIDPLKILRPIVMNGEPASPVEIPVGIPLLARILPKSESEDDEPREKIPLERLFTPATDFELLVPQKKKKAFASSCFYRPDHPTIDDQVELAHKISVSLVDENNKSSKGHNMYMKRKNRSSKWVHQAAQYDMEEVEEEKKPSLEKPPLKLLLNPKGIQDYTAVQRHYEELMTAAQAAQEVARMEMSKEIASTLESPTGKGAALFAKRKKRMDKFIIDETNVQQQQAHQINSIHEETTKSTEIVTSSQQSFSASSATHDVTHFDTFTTIPLNGPASLGAPPIGHPGNLQLPDLTQILTQPKPPEKTTSSLSSRSAGTGRTSKTTSARSRSADFKPLASTKSGFPTPSFGSLYSQKPVEKKGGASEKGASGSYFAQGSPLQLRPGTPPTFLVPDGAGSFKESQTRTMTAEIDNASSSGVTTINEGGAIYKAEVKVVQKPSLSTTSVIDFPISALPQHSILDHLQATKEDEKRNSFNLAAKGWGTYNNFYTPVHLGTV